MFPRDYERPSQRVGGPCNICGGTHHILDDCKPSLGQPYQPYPGHEYLKTWVWKGVNRTNIQKVVYISLVHVYLEDHCSKAMSRIEINTTRDWLRSGKLKRI